MEDNEDNGSPSKRRRLSEPLPTSSQELLDSNLEGPTPTLSSDVTSNEDSNDTNKIVLPSQKRHDAVPVRNRNVLLIAKMLIGAEILAKAPWPMIAVQTAIIKNLWCDIRRSVLNEQDLYGTSIKELPNLELKTTSEYLVCFERILTCTSRPYR